MDYLLELMMSVNIMMDAHEGQVDKAGRPYYFHPLEVARGVEGEKSKIVAILHDVVEDSDGKYSFDDLAFLEDDLIEAIKLLTHDEKDDYFDYVRKIKESGNQLAIEVKLSDLTKNSDVTKIKNSSEKDYKRQEKYNKAIGILTE